MALIKKLPRLPLSQQVLLFKSSLEHLGDIIEDHTKSFLSSF